MVFCHSFRTWCRSEWQTPQKSTSSCTSCGRGSRRRMVAGPSPELAPEAAKALASYVPAVALAAIDVACSVSLISMLPQTPCNLGRWRVRIISRTRHYGGRTRQRERGRWEDDRGLPWGQPDRPQTPPLGPRLKAPEATGLRARTGSPHRYGGWRLHWRYGRQAAAHAGDRHCRRPPTWSPSSSSSSPGDVASGPRTIGGQRLAVLVGAQVRCASKKAVVDVGQDRAGIDRRAAGGQSQILRRDRHRRVARNVHGRNTGLVGDPDAMRLQAGAGAEAREAGVGGRAVEKERPVGLTPVEAVVVEVGAPVDGPEHKPDLPAVDRDPQVVAGDGHELAAGPG